MKTSFGIVILMSWLVACNTSQQDWMPHIIDNTSSGADGVKLGDINKDGFMDIVTGWEEGGITKLYLNPGSHKVKSVWPSVIVGQTLGVEDAVFADMNNDGVLDIVSATEKHSEKIFIHTATKKEFLTADNWKQSVLPASDGLMMWMYLEPLQIDNQYGVDLIAAGKGENSKIGWFQAPANPASLEDWIWHPINPTGWVMSIILRDMDLDGDDDIVITDRRGELVGCRWLENPSDSTTQKLQWKSHFIGAEGLEVMFMTIADLDGDGVEEVILTERSTQTIRIYTAQNSSGLNWSEQIIQVPKTTGLCKSVEVGDVNHDKIPDFILSTNTEKEAKDGLVWLDGRALKETDKFTFTSISGVHLAKYDKVELLDLDLDGDLDVLICEENYGENSEGLGVIWYENKIRN